MAAACRPLPGAKVPDASVVTKREDDERIAILPQLLSGSKPVGTSAEQTLAGLDFLGINPAHHAPQLFAHSFNFVSAFTSSSGKE